jgi:hypothetical protein
MMSIWEASSSEIRLVRTARIMGAMPLRKMIRGGFQSEELDLRGYDDHGHVVLPAPAVKVLESGVKLDV